MHYNANNADNRLLHYPHYFRIIFALFFSHYSHYFRIIFSHYFRKTSLLFALFSHYFFALSALFSHYFLHYFALFLQNKSIIRIIFALFYYFVALAGSIRREAMAAFTGRPPTALMAAARFQRACCPASAC